MQALGEHPHRMVSNQGALITLISISKNKMLKKFADKCAVTDFFHRCHIRTATFLSYYVSGLIPCFCRMKEGLTVKNWVFQKAFSQL